MVPRCGARFAVPPPVDGTGSGCLSKTPARRVGPGVGADPVRVSRRRRRRDGEAALDRFGADIDVVLLDLWLGRMGSASRTSSGWCVVGGVAVGPPCGFPWGRPVDDVWVTPFRCLLHVDEPQVCNY